MNGYNVSPWLWITLIVLFTLGACDAGFDSYLTVLSKANELCPACTDTRGVK